MSEQNTEAEIAQRAAGEWRERVAEPIDAHRDDYDPDTEVWRCHCGLTFGFREDHQAHQIDAVMAAVAPLLTTQPAVNPHAKPIRDAVHELEEAAWDTAISMRQVHEYEAATKWVRVAGALNDVGQAIDRIDPPAAGGTGGARCGA